ncbi:MAG TPA: hypothetical protein DDW74_04070 [Porphyromonadaceae bacterium]|nr:hypothetical protein [Porphyromonadaceae bacterium]
MRLFFSFNVQVISFAQGAIGSYAIAIGIGHDWHFPGQFFVASHVIAPHYIQYFGSVMYRYFLIVDK